VPRFTLVTAPTNVAGRFRFPVSVRPRCEPDSSSVVVRDDRELEAAVRAVVDRYDQDAFVEEVVEGLEVRAPLLGNDTVESFPLLEHVPQEKRERCPARVSDEQSSAVRECAYKAYRALRCRDYARVDVRITATGELVVVDVRWANLLEPDGSFSRAAQRAGISFHELVGRVVEEASLRYSLPTRSGRDLVRVRESRALSAPAERLLGARTTVEGSP
jgi:D-alanine-D-alanine ligase